MRILQIIHQFLPRHQAGSEIYTYRLSQELAHLGHDVSLFFTETRSGIPEYEVTRRNYRGLSCFEVNRFPRYPTFRSTYSDPRMESVFERVLGDVDPDVVHIQHLHFHSIGYPGLAAARGVPVVYTLHEYMLLCLRWGQLLLPDGTICSGPEPSACARCATIEPHPFHLEQGAETGPRTRFSRLRELFRQRHNEPTANTVEIEPQDIERRQSEIRRQLDQVSLLVAPSHCLRDLFLQSGWIDPERIIQSDYGFAREPFMDLERSTSDTIRAGFIGTISAAKGVDLIFEAFRDLPRGIECLIYGDPEVFPDFTRDLTAAGTPSQIRFMGRVENDSVGRVLADLDLLIVPSIWLENSPLTIHEAFLAGVPVLTADRGGMAELVEDGISGLHFRLGDARDLRAKLVQILDDPATLSQLSAGSPPVKSIREDAQEMVARYGELIHAAAGKATRNLSGSQG